MLDRFYTVFHARKDSLTALFHPRKDPEQISLEKVRTFPFIAPLVRFGNAPYVNNSMFDKLVSLDLRRSDSYKVFLGWSGMSLRSILQARKDNKVSVLERGSTHIRYQFDLLDEEYKNWNLKFHGDPRVAEQEEEEYELADYVVVPSTFVRNTFIRRGYPADKIFVNNFGASSYFEPSAPKRSKFTIAYVGNLSVRKGLPYLFNALHQLSIPEEAYDVWFIGNITSEIKQLIPKYQRANWKFFGFVRHPSLAELLSQCSIAVQPSIEEGMSMVIPQLMACGTPVIATTNTGGEDFIKDRVNGFIVPIRDPRSLVDRIQLLYEDDALREQMQGEAVQHARLFGSWDQYGERYANFLGKIS